MGSRRPRRHIYICCRRGIWSHLGSQRGGFGPRGASQIPLGAVSRLFYRGFVVSERRAQIVIFPPPCGLKCHYFFDHQNRGMSDFRKFRLKRSVFCLLCLARPQLGFKIESLFLYTFGCGASSVWRVFRHLTKPLVL